MRTETYFEIQELLMDAIADINDSISSYSSIGDVEKAAHEVHALAEFSGMLRNKYSPVRKNTEREVTE